MFCSKDVKDDFKMQSNLFYLEENTVENVPLYFYYIF